ncbi:MAG: transcription elongation factor GreA [Lachnospiraceae bacterium]|nr:transcription elongation factor GreA [Lachnospiraceae bacterium]
MAREKLTKNDVAKIEAEIEDRKLNVRKQLIKEVKEARAQGDLSENFEYYAAKKAKNENESRISYLEGLLKTAEIISDKSKKDEVGLNNTVRVYFEEDDEEQTFKIVTSIRGNSIRNMISNESPIGKAIMGKKVGTRVKIKVNENYSYHVVIKEIDKSTDDSNDTINRF